MPNVNANDNIILETFEGHYEKIIQNSSINNNLS